MIHQLYPLKCDLSFRNILILDLLTYWTIKTQLEKVDNSNPVVKEGSGYT